MNIAPVGSSLGAKGAHAIFRVTKNRSFTFPDPKLTSEGPLRTRGIVRRKGLPVKSRPGKAKKPLPPRDRHF